MSFFRDWDSGGGLNHSDQRHKMSGEGNHGEEMTWLWERTKVCWAWSCTSWPVRSRPSFSRSLPALDHWKEKILSVAVSEEDCSSWECRDQLKASFLFICEACCLTDRQTFDWQTHGQVDKLLDTSYHVCLHEYITVNRCVAIFAGWCDKKGVLH